MSTPAILIAAAAGGAGNTTVCLGIAHALENRGLKVATFKAGAYPRDTQLHAWVMQQPVLNLDSWTMRFDTLLGLFGETAEGMDIVIGDGHAGLFDSEALGRGSDADLAALLGIPIILVVDAKGAGRSLAPMVEGLLRARDDIDIVGIFLNSVNSALHATDLIRAFDDRFSTPVVGYLIDDPNFELEDHHYRAARALDGEDLDTIVHDIGQAVADVSDLDRIVRLANAPTVDVVAPRARPLPALGQRIAIAQDEAFAFGHESIMTGWHRQGVQLFPFSPLADEQPSLYADAVYLPPGPFEDYAGLLASRRNFIKGLAEAVTRRATIYAEGLGYSMLGEFLIDQDGERHAMAALLPLTTKIQAPTLLVGYRQLRLQVRHPLGSLGGELRGFDNDELVEVECRADRLFDARSAEGVQLGRVGCFFETVSGSPVALMDRHLHLAVVRG